MTDEAEVIFDHQGPVGLITINRPKVLNAVTHNIVRLMDKRLRSWATNDAVEMIVLTSAGDKAFSAGGDIRTLYDWGPQGHAEWQVFYREEYVLNHLIKTYPKPYVVVMNGIDMGGGVGLSVHGSHRISTENLTFAMPETGIGLFPDVGGAYFLPRCPGEVGMYLGLTGRRLKAADAIYAGIADRYMAADRQAEFIDLLVGGKSIDEAITTVGSRAEVAGQLPDIQSLIDEHFSKNSMIEIMASLDACDDPWATKVAAEIRSKSPTSVEVAFRQIRDGRELDFAQCMAMELRIVYRIMAQADFYEGVRAVIIDKDQNPIWSPASLAEIDKQKIDAHFADLGDLELKVNPAV
jgi:enoyl-CoA hydratase